MRQPQNDIVNDQGQKTGVILDIADYHKMLAELEELEAIRAYEAAKAEGGEAIAFEAAMAEIEGH